MMKDEWRMTKDDDFKLFRGFGDGRTNRRTDICDCRVAFATENISHLYLNYFHHLPPHSPYKEFLWKLPKKTKYKNDKNEIGITKWIYIKLFHVTWLILRRFSHIFNINASIIEIPDMVFLRLLVILPEIKSCITFELKLWNCCYISL